MALTIKKGVLWRKELAHRPGTLAESLKPLAEAGVGLQVVMGYRFPGQHERAALEVFPVTGAKAETAARGAGLHPFEEITCLIVQGDDQAGLGSKISDALAIEGINIAFVIVQVIGRQWHGVFGFESQEDADRATSVIKTAGAVAAPRRAAARKPAAKRGAAKRGGAKKTTRKAGAKKPAAKKGKPKAGTKKTAAKKAGAKKKPAAKRAGAKKPAKRRK